MNLIGTVGANGYLRFPLLNFASRVFGLSVTSITATQVQSEAITHTAVKVVVVTDAFTR